MRPTYEYRLVQSSDYKDYKEFIGILNLYGEEGYHIVGVRGNFDISSVLMEKEIMVEEISDIIKKELGL